MLTHGKNSECSTNIKLVINFVSKHSGPLCGGGDFLKASLRIQEAEHRLDARSLPSKKTYTIV